MNAYGSNDRWLGQANLFLPLEQSEDSMLFLDFRGLWTDDRSTEGNWGIGYRKILASERIVGVYGFFDHRSTSQNNAFSQATFGAELLDVNWGVRMNGYVPETGIKGVVGGGGAGQLVFQGGNVFMQSGSSGEVAYWGMDFEAEGLLWRRENSCNTCSAFSLANLDAELWASAGVYHFDHDDAGSRGLTGPRLRTELRLYDLPLLGFDSRFVATAQYEHDQIRGSVGSGMLSLRIPFGKGRKSSDRKLNALGRRMVNPIVRDIDIVSNQKSTLGELEGVKVGDLGQEITSYHAITTSDDVEDYIENTASTNALIVIDGTPGAYNYASGIVMKSGQAIVGGGGTVEFTGVNSGTKLNHTFSGSSPIINSSDSGMVSFNIKTSDYAVVNNIQLQGTESGIHSGSKDGVQLINNHVSNTNLGFRIYNGSNALIMGNTANGNAFYGFLVNDLTNSTFNGNTASSSVTGFYLTDITNSTFNDNTATNNSVSGYSNFTGMTGTTNEGNTGTGNGSKDTPSF